MADENENALRTALGRERMLEDHEDRLDDHDARLSKIEGKNEASDKRWDLIVKALVTIGGGIIIAVVSALIAGGTVHP